MSFALGNYLPFFSSPLHLSRSDGGRCTFSGSFSKIFTVYNLMHWGFLLLGCVLQSLPLKNSPTTSATTSTFYFWDGKKYSAGDDEKCLLPFIHETAWNTGWSDQRILFLTVRGSLRCFFANSKFVFMRLHWGENGVWPQCHKAQIGGVLQWCLGFSHLHIWSWSSTRVTIRLLVTSLDKALLRPLLSLTRRPALGRVLVVPNFFH